MGGELPLRCENKHHFLQMAIRERQLPLDGTAVSDWASRGLQSPEEKNEQAFSSGFAGPPRTEVRGSPNQTTNSYRQSCYGAKRAVGVCSRPLKTQDARPKTSFVRDCRSGE